MFLRESFDFYHNHIFHHIYSEVCVKVFVTNVPRGVDCYKCPSYWKAELSLGCQGVIARQRTAAVTHRELGPHSDFASRSFETLDRWLNVTGSLRNSVCLSNDTRNTVCALNPPI
ncbi:uncharacterized protein LOC116852075 [Odontomachus brunneus]|uniref:uncharacterized protein LOC116852075 n=1 Tax=Odontomachus brunneus TaxID=486640 RepID=UPI0013F1BC37|nr:uncharacterized protein LOC116852075 [Odontomachus brunneus]